ncbi:hypothetical protein VAWG002_19800 [Aeromonas veronii]|nr:hypothetical protein VAWG002_19800 [Aeromonas veronii]
MIGTVITNVITVNILRNICPLLERFLSGNIDTPSCKTAIKMPIIAIDSPPLNPHGLLLWLE